MSNRHTPGPWKSQPLQRDHGATIAIVDENSFIIAQIPPLNPDDYPDYKTAHRYPADEPNAHLISAAPELLDQVEDGCRVVADIVAVYADAIGTESEPGWIADLREWLTTARTAIAKATGQNQKEQI